jgi:hypothetical protein
MVLRGLGLKGRASALLGNSGNRTRRDGSCRHEEGSYSSWRPAFSRVCYVALCAGLASLVGCRNQTAQMPACFTECPEKHVGSCATWQAWRSRTVCRSDSLVIFVTDFRNRVDGLPEARHYLVHKHVIEHGTHRGGFLSVGVERQPARQLPPREPSVAIARRGSRTSGWNAGAVRGRENGTAAMVPGWRVTMAAGRAGCLGIGNRTDVQGS